MLSGLLKHNAPAVRQLGNPDVDGWSRLRDALQGPHPSSPSFSIFRNKPRLDPEITVRRKTIFLLATLLLPTTPIPTPPEPHPGPHPGLHAPSAPSPERPEDPVHDNSHAVHIKDPSRSNTSELTLAAFRDCSLLEAVISALTDPVPYGEDGDIQEADPTFEEQAVR